MQQPELSWISLRVDDAIIDSALGNGSFAYVYRGVSLADGQPVAFKLARRRDSVQRVAGNAPEKTNAKAFFTGGLRDVKPDAEELLDIQFRKLKKANDPALVRVENLVRQEDLCYFRMEHIQGQNLRQVWANGDNLSIHRFIELASIMSRLSQNQQFRFHGDLKPENIMVTPTGIRLIDPGHFGPLTCQEGAYNKTAITTACYYPYLEPNDLLAFGIILWEAIVRTHPFLVTKEKQNLMERPQGDGLRQKIKRYSMLGYFNLEPLSKLERPIFLRENITDEMEAFLLKAVGLKLDDQLRIDEGEAFKNFAEIEQALSAVAGTGFII